MNFLPVAGRTSITMRSRFCMKCRIDSENLYRVLQDQVIPCFYERDAQGIPRRWIQMVRRAMATLVPRFTTWRMVQEYTQKYYLP